MRIVAIAVAGIAVLLVLLALPHVRAWFASTHERRTVIAGYEGHLVTVSLSIGVGLVVDHDGFVTRPKRDGFTLESPTGEAQWVPYGQVQRLSVGPRDFGPW